MSVYRTIGPLVYDNDEFALNVAMLFKCIFINIFL